MRVVGSSGRLSNASLGKIIDSHDAVIRMNSAPTANYEIDVGSRTTVRVWSETGYNASIFASEESILLQYPSSVPGLIFLQDILHETEALPGGGSGATIDIDRFQMIPPSAIAEMSREWFAQLGGDLQRDGTLYWFNSALACN